ncbi:MAG: putative selenium-dependent hydroxylase accessory protein YqeC [Firmicutes bacterium]|nr:putative selenium-dependent hydroxylase accessory protein YqeC [Bacillota bacterium]
MLADALGIKQPGVVACVGAGGKTSLVQSLAAEKAICPVVVTSTTKMFYEQVAEYQLVIENHCDTGMEAVRLALADQQQAAWFSRQQDEKVIGLPPDWVDNLAAALPAVTVLVEADGARRCLVKAPNAQEPVIPVSTMTTVGILNLSILGQPLAPDNAHRLELVSRIISKQQGEIIAWQDIARLVIHSQGLFQYAKGKRVLLLSGGADGTDWEAVRQIAGYVKKGSAGIERLVVSSGYGSDMQAVEVYVL